MSNFLCQELLLILSLTIVIVHGARKIKIMMRIYGIIVQFCTKEPGGTTIAITRISMVYIFVEITPPTLME